MKFIIRMLLLATVMLSAGCTFRHYLGLHGPSMRNFPDAHDPAITQDSQCLSCHSPQNAAAGSGAPATTHPGFAGCLKCHSDPI